MHIRYLSGNHTGETAELPLIEAQNLLASGFAELATPVEVSIAPVAEAPPVEAPVAEPVVETPAAEVVPHARRKH